MKPLLIAEKMTDIDEKFILGSMPPPLAIAAKPPRSKRKAPLLIFGSIAAALSGVLAVGLVVAFITMGGRIPLLPPPIPKRPQPPPRIPKPSTPRTARPRPKRRLSIPRGLRSKHSPTEPAVSAVWVTARIPCW